MRHSFPHCLIIMYQCNRTHSPHRHRPHWLSCEIHICSALWVGAGTVLCHPGFPLMPAAKIAAKIVTLDAVRVPLLVGSTVVLHAYSLAVEAKVSALTAQLDPKTG